MSNKNNNISPVGAIKHDDERRASIPTTELAGEESLVAESMSPEGQYKQFKHDSDRGHDPELYWLGKYENDDEPILRHYSLNNPYECTHDFSMLNLLDFLSLGLR